MWQQRHRGRDWSDTCTSQGLPTTRNHGKYCRQPWKPGGKRERVLSESLQKEHGPRILWSQTDFHTLREYTSVLWNHPALENLHTGKRGSCNNPKYIFTKQQSLKVMKQKSQSPPVLKFCHFNNVISIDSFGMWLDSCAHQPIGGSILCFSIWLGYFLTLQQWMWAAPILHVLL